MTITAAEVKKLRDATGAGMLDSKKALEEAAGDFEKAIEVLRVKGAAKAAKRGQERTASAGLVASSGGAMIQLGCETDFVAKSEGFIDLGTQVVAAAQAGGAGSVEDLAGRQLPSGRTVEEAVSDLAAVIGEKLELAKVATFEGRTVSYLHRRSTDLPPSVGVLVEFEGEDEQAARGVAMQVAAMRPDFVARADVPADLVEKERAIAEATAREEGKPEQALPKIVEGRLGGFFKDVVLLEQPSVQDSKRTVKAVLDDAGINVTRFARFEVGR